jgi:hypothetical protein
MKNTLDVLENGKMHHNILDLGLLECRSQHAYVKFQAGMAANLRNWIQTRRQELKNGSGAYKFSIVRVNQKGWL